MSYLALYRKYRPSDLNEVVGQRNVIKILLNSIKLNKVSHAYLFYGPRGTGKTTIAKAFSKLINCESLVDLKPCNSCSSCVSFVNKNNPDIIEIDAASNNGVGEIREIRDSVSLLPSISKYKVYIIDEVHMLSISAFNALLKTLEEPPQHAIFILATTEFYKVPETIVSRCQCLEFSRISNNDIVERLKFISNEENIKIDDETLNLIAEYSNGGLRDAIGMLDKLSLASDSITKNDFYDLKGIVSNDELKRVLDSIFDNDIKNTLNICSNYFNAGKNINLFVYQVQNYLKNLIISYMSNNKYDSDYDIDSLYLILDIVNNTLLEMKKLINYELLFDVMIIKIYKKLYGNPQLNVNKNNLIANDENNNINEVKENDIVEKKDTIVVNKNKIEEGIVVDKSIKERNTCLSDDFYENKKIIINNALATGNKNYLQDLKAKWVNLSDYLYNQEFASIISFLMDGNVNVVGEKYVIISEKYDSLVLNADLNIEKLQVLLNLIAGRMLKIAFITEDEWNKIKNKFIDDKKNGINYFVKDEIVFKIKENSETIEKSHSESYNNAVILFGEDIVEER